MTTRTHNEYGPVSLGDQNRPRGRRKSGFHVTEADEELLSRLSETWKEILQVEGSIADIARRLDIPPGTVKSRSYRARKALEKLRAEAKDGNRH
jgi:DNA-directed RNA polymerase specialized sigma24 family protein